ncbi:NAD(P)-dependent oxidoreductase [Amycolatopsis sp. NPDC023774]|uniref:NAD(P)-dependent oxidoreductase n=1 Tax=Amycolatopsis sp. NPDC023774 TaxID=3155015 RepID=UPI0033C3C1F9
MRSNLDRHRPPAEAEQELDLTFHDSAAAMAPHCDVVTVNAPLHRETEGLFDDDLIATMTRGQVPGQHRGHPHRRPCDAIVRSWPARSRIVVRRHAHSKRVPHRRHRQARRCLVTRTRPNR